MRILIISDIHANLAAFKAVLADAEGQWEQIWCLGDIVGYGPSPNECISLLREQNHSSLSGNHDWAALGKLDISTFNRVARLAVTWTKNQLTSESIEYLNALPARIEQPIFTLAHASPRQPVWEYILDAETAAINFDYFKSPYCLVGHTHVPVVYEADDEKYVSARPPNYDAPLQLITDYRYIINPGSVGQPRDANPDAAYALLDTESLVWQHKRTPYPITQTQALMRDNKMPARLIERLAYGW